MTNNTPENQNNNRGHGSGLPARQSKSTQNSGGGRGLAMLIIGIVILLVFFVIGMVPRTVRNAKLRQRAKAAADSKIQVPVVKLRPSPAGDLSIPGTTEAIVDAIIQPRSSGYLSKRFVDIGDRVKMGQTLALIESPDVDQQLYQAQAQETQSHAITQQAVADLANKQSTVSQYRSNVTQAEANVEQGNAQLSDAKAKLAQLVAAKAMSEAQLDEAKHQVGIKQAALVQAETQSNLADVTYKRYKTLLDSGYVALQDADQAEAAAKTAVAAVNSAQADLKASQSAVNAAVQQVQSASANVKSGEAEVLAAEKSVRAVEATVHSNEATVAAAKANVLLGRSNVAANIDAERANSANTKHFAVLTSFEKVVAPFPGVITARNVDVGYLVSAGGSSGGGGASSGSSQGSAVNVGSASGASAAPSTSSSAGLFGLARTDIIRILVSVPETYSTSIRTGDVARINIREFPSRTFHGTVARMAGALDSNSRTLLTEIHINNRDGALLPGMFAQVHFDLPNPTGDFRIPSSALIFDSLGTRLAIVDQDNKVHFVKVNVTRDYGKEIDIHDGLSGTENVVVNPTDDLTDGEVVRPVLAPAPPGTGPTGKPTQAGSSSRGSNGTGSSVQSAEPGLGGPGQSGAQPSPTSQQGVPSEPGTPPSQSGGAQSQQGRSTQQPSQSQPGAQPQSSGFTQGRSQSSPVPGNGPVIQGGSSGSGSTSGAGSGGASGSGGAAGGGAAGGTGGGGGAAGSPR